jgi:hypothetical protein
MKIISKNYGLRLIREGRAIIDGTCTNDDGTVYVVLSRTDTCETTHYRA